ncbi:hypothetical protein ACHQM5_021280 [Ranunculus cassubicifolius]
MEHQSPMIQRRNGENHHVIEVFKSVERKRQEMPRLLRTSAGDESCSIFRAPENLSKNTLKGDAFEPHIVSIGPYHHGKDQLQMIEEHKGRYLDNLLSRTKDKSFEDFFNAIYLREEEARKSYSGYIDLGTEKFVEMLVLDGCFIIEIIRMSLGKVRVNYDDPIFMMQWAIPILTRDFIKLENQLPFFVLQEMFDLSKGEGEEEEEVVEDISLTFLALKFFNYALSRPDEVIKRWGETDLKPFHLLDLLRLTFIPGDNVSKAKNSSLKVIQCATKLYKNGIGFEAGESDSLFQLEFKKGRIQIPTVTLDDFMTSVFLNCIAFEQCHQTKIKHVNIYAAVLACLINRPEDVELLRDSEVIENYYGTNKEVSNFFIALGKEVSFDSERTYVLKFFEDVNEHYRNEWRIQWTSFTRTYCSTPWKAFSVLAAIILLLLTTAQTVFSVLSYVHPQS